MRLKNIALVVITALCVVSCAHKSGRNRSAASTQRAETSGRHRNNNQRNLDVVIANNRDDDSKLDGSKIFAKYNHAVFMVFTSDGYNGYQGSGFFVNSQGLAVSNYHVF